jgi:hypothetical protein
LRGREPRARSVAGMEATCSRGRFDGAVDDDDDDDDDHDDDDDDDDDDHDDDECPCRCSSIKKRWKCAPDCMRRRVGH